MTWPGPATRPSAGCTRCCGLVPGGHPREISAAQAARILERVTPSGAVARARCELAAEFLTDIRRLDAQLRDTNKKLAAAVKASGTSLTGIFGAGPVIAGTVAGDVRQVFRFPDRDHFAACNGTAPVEVSSGVRKACRLSLRGNRRLNHAIHMAAISQIRHKHSQGRACYDKKLARARRTRRRCGPSSGGSATPSTRRWWPAPGRRRLPAPRAREGNRGTSLSPGRPVHTPHTGSSGKPLPGLPPPYGPAPPQVAPQVSRGCLGPSGLRILIGSSPERTGSRGREIPEIYS
ncbi:MAG TPA: transposase [Streptosporangiaceae bacterium]